MSTGFRYRRRVQFAETDMAGIVHFSVFFRYMEEAEHALWRAAGLTIEEVGQETGWPRVSAAIDFKAPLRFEDEIEVTVEIAAVSRRTIRYRFTITRGEATIATGLFTTACVVKAGTPLKAIDVPPGVVDRLRAASGGER